MGKFYEFLTVAVIVLISFSGIVYANSSSYITIDFDETYVSEWETIEHLNNWKYPVVKNPLKTSQEFVFRLEFEDKKHKRGQLVVVVSSTVSDNPLQLYLEIVNILIEDEWILLTDPEVDEIPIWNFINLDFVLNSIRITRDTVTAMELLFKANNISDNKKLLEELIKGSGKISEIF